LQRVNQHAAATTDIKKLPSGIQLGSKVSDYELSFFVVLRLFRRQARYSVEVLVRCFATPLLFPEALVEAFQLALFKLN
jgi:hypothetical protein